MPLEHLELVEADEQLGAALEALEDLEAVGVDIERADWDRYYRAAALLQIGGNGRVVVIDPLAVDDLEPLSTLLDCRVAVFHAIENDLGPLQSLGVHPPRVEDTAIAAALLGLPTGLERLSEELLGVPPASDKAAMQRADWNARPLAEDMLAYAAGDVADLPALWAALAERLQAADRLQWYREELGALLSLPTVEERRDWTRTKGAGRLDPRARVRLRHLWERREALAKATDTAPGRIAADRVLIELAVEPPRAVSELGRRGVRRQAIRAFGEELLEALDEAERTRSEPEPQRPLRRPTSEARAVADRLRALRADIALAHGLDPGVLCPSRVLLTAVLAEPESPDELRAALAVRDWQWELLGEAFCDELGIGAADGSTGGEPGRNRASPTPDPRSATDGERDRP